MLQLVKQVGKCISSVAKTNKTNFHNAVSENVKCSHFRCFCYEKYGLLGLLVAKTTITCCNFGRGSIFNYSKLIMMEYRPKTFYKKKILSISWTKISYFSLHFVPRKICRTWIRILIQLFYLEYVCGWLFNLTIAIVLWIRSRCIKRSFVRRQRS